MSTAGTIFLLALVIGVVFVLVKAIRIVPQGFQWTVERFGEYTHTLHPGLHLLIPVVQAVGHKINIMEQVMDVPSQDVITKDNAVVRVDGVVFYTILDAAQAAYQVSDLENAIINLVQTNIRTAIGSLDLDETLSKRDEINAKLLAIMDGATAPWGVKINRIELKDIAPPRDLVDSMARQMKAEREKRANILEAEGFRAAEILRAEGEKQSAILKAEAEKESSVRIAEGQREAAFLAAEAREREAQAEAKAIADVSTAIASGSQESVNYFTAIKSIEALGGVVANDNSKLVIVPTEMGALTGALGAVAEMIKNNAAVTAKK